MSSERKDTSDKSIAVMDKRSYDTARISIIFAGLVAGVICFVFFPAHGKASSEAQATIATIFSIFGGFQMAIFAALSSLDSNAFRSAFAKRAANRSVLNRFRRQGLLFYLYVAVISLIVLDQAFFFEEYEFLIQRFYISAAITALIWSLEIPRALASVHDDYSTMDQ